jgi:ABC-type antimicrobial peptide transport system permease subunit
VALPLVYNVRNVRVRWPVAALAVVSIALVVAAVTVLLAMSQGFASALRGTGRADNAIVVGRGSNSETTSRVALEHRNAILDHVQAANGAAVRPLASWDSVSVLSMARRSDGKRTNVVLRAVLPHAYAVRSGIRLIQGRAFTPGLDEVIVGRRIVERVRGLELGGTVRYRRRPLRIVGVFEAEGAAFESEIWTDFDILTPYRMPGSSSSLVVRMQDTAQIAALDRWIRLQPNMPLRAVSERRYYEDQAGPVAKTIRGLGLLVAVVMGVGAVFAAMNTMYRIVAMRTREIGTLRALGFSRRAILSSFVVESGLLGVVGGALGCVGATALHGYSVSTSNLQSFSEVAFAFRITPEIVAGSMGFALTMGVLGGLLPAVRAARQPIAAAIRQD